MRWLEVETCGHGESDFVLKIAQEIAEDTGCQAKAEERFCNRLAKLAKAGEISENAGDSLSFTQHQLNVNGGESVYPVGNGELLCEGCLEVHLHELGEPNDITTDKAIDGRDLPIYGWVKGICNDCERTVYATNMEAASND